MVAATSLPAEHVPPRRLSMSVMKEVQKQADAQQRSAHEREALATILRTQGGGSLLRGWHRELDPDWTLEVSFQNFFEASKRLHIAANAHMQLKKHGLPRDLTLAEVAPDEAALLERFMKWVKECFGGPLDLFPETDVLGEGRVDSSDFWDFCVRKGFVATESELEELKGCCDVDGIGTITKERLLFLEVDRRVRDIELFKAKMSRKEQRQQLMASVYAEACSKPQRHRLAQRPWQRQTFERLPAVAHQKRSRRQKEAHQRSLQAQSLFMQHIRRSYGSEVRAWRRELVTDGSFVLPLKELRRYCRKINLDVDASELWKFFDRDGDGAVRLEEVCVGAADALASFHRWARADFGSCSSLWDHPVMVSARSSSQDLWALGKKMLLSTFGASLKTLGWPGIDDSGVKNMVFASLDQYGCGFIEHSDLEWLDGWEPPGYLSVDRPDPEAWNEIRALVLKMYKHPLLAWRTLFDQDNSNSVSWAEFERACEHLKFKGNIGGAWRSLDIDLSGTISLKEFDAESSDILKSFKEWADQHFGSVELAIKSLDIDNSGSVSFAELRRACEKLKWSGDVRLLFDCLDVDRKKDRPSNTRSLSFEEVSFLDSWHMEPSEDQLCEDAPEETGRMAAWSAPLSSGRPTSGLQKKKRSSSKLLEQAFCTPDQCMRRTAVCTEQKQNMMSSSAADAKCSRKTSLAPESSHPEGSTRKEGNQHLTNSTSLPDLTTRLHQAYSAGCNRKPSRRRSARRRLPFLLDQLCPSNDCPATAGHQSPAVLREVVAC